jgi:hypothetical protein
MKLQNQLNQHLAAHFEKAQFDWKEFTIEDYPDRQLVRRELYPWNNHEPDRCSEESIQFLNEQMAQCAPKLEVRVIEMQDLAFATIE